MEGARIQETGTERTCRRTLRRQSIYMYAHGSGRTSRVSLPCGSTGRIQRAGKTIISSPRSNISTTMVPETHPTTGAPHPTHRRKARPSGVCTHAIAWQSASDRCPLRKQSSPVRCIPKPSHAALAGRSSACLSHASEVLACTEVDRRIGSICHASLCTFFHDEDPFNDLSY
jgi:hypothetical protein